MDIFKGIGDFFSSVFGGNKNNDEEKRRKAEEERRRREAAAKASQQQAANRKKSAQGMGDMLQRPNQPKPRVAPQPIAVQPVAVPKPVLSIDQPAPVKQIQAADLKRRAEIEKVAQTGKFQPGTNLTPNDVKTGIRQYVERQAGGTPYERAVDAVPISLQKMVGGIASIPERIVRSGAQLLDKAVTGQDADYSAKGKTSGLQRFLYGSNEGVQTYQKQGEDTSKGVKQLTGAELPAPLLAAAFVGLDVGGLGIGAALKNVTREGVDAAVRSVVGRAERDLGRSLTEEEAKDLAQRTEKAIADEAAKQPDAIPEPTKPDTFDSDEAFRRAQDERQGKLKQNPVARMFDTVKRNVFDPRTVQQKLDNDEFRRLKTEGAIPKGQKELTPEQSIATQQGLIENPQRAASVRNAVPVKVGNNAYSLNDIIKFYGKEDSDTARAFESYRIYKDELERLAKGGDNTVGVDPLTMAKFVTEYETRNPVAIEHNAALRQISLDALQARREARIDAPELFENSAKFEFYNPRVATDPEDLIRPTMSGGVRSGAKGTQLRAETAGGVVRSPLQVFLDRNTEVERALATQRRDMLIREKAKQGVPGFSEVVNADTALEHKQALTTMRDLGDTIKSLGAVKKGAKSDLNKAQQVAKAKTDAVSLVREYLAKASPDDIMADVARYADSVTDDEALDLFTVLTDAGAKNTGRIANKIAKDTGVTPQEIKDFITGVRQEIKGVKADRTAAFNDMLDTTQNLERGTQTITYKLDGESGKIEIPFNLANELSKANEARTLSPVERGMQGLANAQKITWTGALSPVFKTYNVLVKNPLLAYRNADGLSGVSPQALSAGLGSLFRTPTMQAFKNEMLKRGAAYENALQTKNVYTSVADDIAARSGVKEFFARNPVTTLNELWKGLNHALAAPDNAQRTAVAYGAYTRARKLGLSEEDALSIASQAPAKVFGDFDRVSRLAQNAEIILPYSGAIQAGARAMARATKTKPLETSIKDATFLATAAGLTAYSLSNGSEYYQDMLDKGQEYMLDNNLVVVLPGASKDADGNWTGVVNIPLVPDLRPYNRAVWQSVYSASRDESINPALIAGELFNQFTGDISNSVYDSTRTNKGENPLNGILPSSPIGTALKIGSGVDPRTGLPLSDEYTASKPRTEQANDYTSESAKRLSALLGGAVTPLQVDKFLDQLGNTGNVIQAREDGTGSSNALTQFLDLAKPLAPGKSMTEKGKKGKQFYEDVDMVKSTIQDEKTFKAFEAAHAKGDPDAPKNLLNSATKANQYMQFQDGAFSTTPLFEAERKLDELSRARGEPGNPIFDLPPQALQKVLAYRSSKIANSAKQNYTKDGEGMFQALGLDNKWYSDFTKAEGAFYDSVLPTDGKKEDEVYTFSGQKKRMASPELQAIEEQYYALPEKSDERKLLLAANPELKQLWADQNAFTDAERKALGFSELEGFDAKKGYGGGGSGGRGGVSDENVLNRLLNTAGGVKRLEALPPQEVAALMPALKKLFAPRRGGRASVTIGAKASGNPRA